MGMKCIRCGTDNNLRDRTANFGQCKNCRHPFVFDPSTVTDQKLKFTDKFFANVIADISANDTLFFTQKQLFYRLDRRLNTKTINRGWSMYFTFIFFNIWALGFIGGFLCILLGKVAFIIVSLFVNIIFIGRNFRAKQNSKLSYPVRKVHSKFLQFIGGFILVIGVIISIVINSYFLFIISVLLGMLSLFLGFRPLKNQSVDFLFDQNQFQSWVNRWQQINSIDKILSSPYETTATSSISPDVSAYSFDRAVICDSDELAQLLIANNFHFENNCAILSITGYPHSIFNLVMQMLSRNPELKVYAIHDASPHGVNLAHQLRSNPSWFQNSEVKIYDLGLLPRQILTSPNMFIRSSAESAQEAEQLPSEVRQTLSDQEIKWLDEGNFVELESFSPKRIIKVLTQGIANSQNVTTDGNWAISDDGDGGYVYAVESFG